MVYHKNVPVAWWLNGVGKNDAWFEKFNFAKVKKINLAIIQPTGDIANWKIHLPAFKLTNN